MEQERHEFHKAAEMFPMIEGKEFDDLVQDIEEHGLHTPIELYEGKIIDGRNRYKACLAAGVEPAFITVTPADPIAYVLSRNLHRRHLDTSQRGMVAARARDFYDKQAKERQRVRKGDQPGATVENLPQLEAGKARDNAGELAGVSGKTVDYATTVLRKGEPDLIKAVDEGQMAVSRAAKVAKGSAKRLAAVEEARERRADKGKKTRRKKPKRVSPKKVATDQIKRIEECLNDLQQILDEAKESVAVEDLQPKVKELREIVDKLME